GRRTMMAMIRSVQMTVAEQPSFAARLLDRVVARHQKLPRARYGIGVERNLHVEMRDGVALLADHYFPAGTRGRGTILIRTPYGRGLPINMDARLFAGQGYHVVVQSCRGTFGSGGQFTPMTADMDDGQDTVVWLREQPWFDERLATYGASGVGWTQWALLVDPPPELRTSVIIAGLHDASRFGLGTGAAQLHDLLTWSRVILGQEQCAGLLRTVRIFATASRVNARAVAALPLADAVETALLRRAPWFREWLSHPNLDDPFWDRYNASAALEKVEVPIRLVSGWQDLFLEQTMRQYQALHERGLDVTLTVGPWIHLQTVNGGGGALAAGNLDWLAEHLAGEPVTRKYQPVRVRVTGTDEWHEFPEWPPPTAQLLLYLQRGGHLTEQQQPQMGTSSFTYDPANPTPTVGGPLIDMSAGIRDNGRLEARTDVLTFTTPPLPEALEIIGAPVVDLDHSTSNPNADVFVRLCDVDQKGRSRNFSETFRRLDPTMQESPLQLRLDPCAHRLAAGHRLRLQVSGGSHPGYARNEGSGTPSGTGTELRPCQHTIHHGKSRVNLPTRR
ncbi:MAG: CocE/NonD family hydrolase, partial [Sciscionella sp.]